MRPDLCILVAAALSLTALLPARPAVEQKPGGVLQMPHLASPASARSIHEELTPSRPGSPASRGRSSFCATRPMALCCRSSHTCCSAPRRQKDHWSRAPGTCCCPTHGRRAGEGHIFADNTEALTDAVAAWLVEQQL